MKMKFYKKKKQFLVSWQYVLKLLLEKYLKEQLTIQSWLSMTLEWKRKRNYKESNFPALPRPKRSRKDLTQKLYELEIVDEDPYNGRVKVHYVGYGPEDDEWRDKKDIVEVKPPASKWLFHELQQHWLV